VSACPAVVADNKASGLFLDGPRRQEAFAHCPMSDAFLRCRVNSQRVWLTKVTALVRCRVPLPSTRWLDSAIARAPAVADAANIPKKKWPTGGVGGCRSHRARVDFSQNGKRIALCFWVAHKRTGVARAGPPAVKCSAYSPLVSWTSFRPRTRNAEIRIGSR
jgi:hypothetical protein